MISARLAIPALVAGAVALAQPGAGSAQPPSRSVQATTALDFLSRLESGKPAAAWALLSPPVARVYPAARLAASAPKKRPAILRQLRHEGPVPAASAYAHKLGHKPVGGRHTAWVVCFADVPRSGYGRVGYVAVVLVPDSTRYGWDVSDFRYRSEPDGLCRAKG